MKPDAKKPFSVIKDIMIGFPLYDGKTEMVIAQEMYKCMWDRSNPVRLIHYYSGDSLVARARNSIVARFLDTPECEYLMFIDGDIRFQGWQVAQLRSHAKGVVGGIYLKKKLPYEPVCNQQIGEEGGLSVMQEIGTGFMMIHRGLLLDLISKHPERKYTPYNHEYQSDNYYDLFGTGVCDKTNYYLSEDYFFCKLVREAGHNVYLDSEILVEHVGKFVYPTDDLALIKGASGFLRLYSDQQPIEPIFKAAILDLESGIRDFKAKRSEFKKRLD